MESLDTLSRLVDSLKALQVAPNPESAQLLLDWFAQGGLETLRPGLIQLLETAIPKKPLEVKSGEMITFPINNNPSGILLSRSRISVEFIQPRLDKVTIPVNSTGEDLYELIASKLGVQPEDVYIRLNKGREVTALTRKGTIAEQMAMLATQSQRAKENPEWKYSISVGILSLPVRVRAPEGFIQYLVNMEPSSTLSDLKTKIRRLLEIPMETSIEITVNGEKWTDETMFVVPALSARRWPVVQVGY